ncbi:acetate--CoA ligase [Francisellaceae bacterium]|nr:acetate--CoA ligase [Francisellaceae bacterium]
MTQNWTTKYKDSIQDSTNFWADASTKIDWIKPWKTLTSGSFQQGDVKWFEEGTLNACFNCVDRHLPKRGDKTAVIWEGDSPENNQLITYQALHDKVCKFANILKSMGVQKGGVVCIYMPMIPEAVMAMLACARIGAIHSVIFGGFSPQSIADRILDAKCAYVITADGGFRGGKSIPLKANVDTALQNCPCVKKVLVVKHAKNDIEWVKDRDICYQEAHTHVSNNCPVEEMNAEDPLFILYTSGSTGKPKGVVHTTGGYLLYAAMTHQHIFDLQEDDVYWCTADVGWITGHSYVTYGPLANGATTLIFEGVPTYPSASRFFEVIDKYKVSIFYTAPTAIRALMAKGDSALDNTARKSLRILGSVGEPINHEAWEWYHARVGNSKCPIVDTWWQTETGGIMITPSTKTPQKPGSAMHPFLGIDAAILDKNTGKEISGAMKKNYYGALAIKQPWPGIMRTLFGDHQRYMDTYFAPYPGYYFPSDGAYRDTDGDYWITGRLDDVISIAGHRIGTAEIEDVLNSHPAVLEAAVVGIPDAIKGESIYAYIIMNQNHTPSDELKKEVVQWVRKTYGPIASITAIQWTSNLPKTRSGKIMRRILRKIAHFEEHQIGDTSTLTDSECIEALIQNRIDYRIS